MLSWFPPMMVDSKSLESLSPPQFSWSSFAAARGTPPGAGQQQGAAAQKQQAAAAAAAVAAAAANGGKQKGKKVSLKAHLYFIKNTSNVVPSRW